MTTPEAQPNYNERTGYDLTEDIVRNPVKLLAILRETEPKSPGSESVSLVQLKYWLEISK